MNRLKKLRQEKKLSQKELAENIGVQSLEKTICTFPKPLHFTTLKKYQDLRLILGFFKM